MELKGSKTEANLKTLNLFINYYLSEVFAL